MSSHSYSFHPRPTTGGLVQVSSKGPTSRTQAALQACLRSAKPEEQYFFWAADEGILYPEGIHQEWGLPLNRLLLVKARDAPEVWRLGLEAVQTGLFHSLFLRASRACLSAHLRKLQLAAEKNRTTVFLITNASLPHWTLKETIEAGTYAHALHPQSPTPFRLR